MNNSHKKSIEMNTRNVEHSGSQNRCSNLSSDIADNLLKKEQERISKENLEIHKKHEEQVDKLADAMMNDFN